MDEHEIDINKSFRYVGSIIKKAYIDEGNINRIRLRCLKWKSVV